MDVFDMAFVVGRNGPSHGIRREGEVALAWPELPERYSCFLLAAVATVLYHAISDERCCIEVFRLKPCSKHAEVQMREP